MYKLIRDFEDIPQDSIDPQSIGFCDTETYTDEGKTKGGLYGKIRLVQLFQKEWDEALIIDCMFVPLDRVLALIKPLTLVFHNASFDLHTINRHVDGMWYPKSVHDTVYLSRLVYYTKMRFGFYECLEYSNHADALIRGIDKKEEQKSDWGGPLSKKQLTYAAADVLYLERLYNSVCHKVDDISYRLDIDNLKFAIKYAKRGMPVNQDKVRELKKGYLTELETILERLPINPRSHTQVKPYLGIKSSDKDTLMSLALDGNEKAADIIAARENYKSVEYLNSWDRPVVYGFHNPCSALSGRFSCTGGDLYDGANLMQLPRRLHEIVQAPPGYTFVYKDYSGLELRMGVAFTGEPTMEGFMKTGADMHRETAKYLLSKDEVTKEERDMAKSFNFGLLYGIGVGAFRLVLKSRAGVDLNFRETKAMMNKWFDMYHYFKEWHNIHKHQLAIYGYVDVETALGRKVRTYRLNDSLNLPIQGSSAEAQKVSLMLFNKRYPDNNLINTIHDSNILMQKEEEADMWGKRLDECMLEGWEYVIKSLAIPDLPMEPGYDVNNVWTF